MEFFNDDFEQRAIDIIKPFLKKAKKSNILVLGLPAEKIIGLVDDSIELKTIESFSGEKFNSRDFFELAKKSPAGFDTIFDISFSSHFYKHDLSTFYTYLARALKYKGVLHSLVLSTETEECKKRCPKRHWSYFGKDYIRFISKRELKGFIQSNFNIKDFKKEDFPDGSFHFLISINDMRKF